MSLPFDVISCESLLTRQLNVLNQQCLNLNPYLHVMHVYFLAVSHYLKKKCMALNLINYFSPCMCDVFRPLLYFLLIFICLLLYDMTHSTSVFTAV